MFDAQVDLIRDRYQIQPGETDVPGFPLFALFNLAMQVTTVIPDMDPTRPAAVRPENILEAFRSHHATQAYGSPAMWNRVGRHCETHGLQLPGLRRVLSAGAPVPLHVLNRMTRALPDESDLFTPYGATECLPVASIGAREILRETAALSAAGKGTCVGTPFKGIDVRIIEATDKPLKSLADARVLGVGEIGEIIVRGPVATVWAMSAIWITSRNSGSVAERHISCMQPAARCIPSAAKPFSISTPMSIALRSSVSDHPVRKFRSS
jgi:acyl-CoA synthetase (AMP-forming)/AMP-acid ligase II